MFRQTSDYICPSRFWVETPEEKERLLGDYKKNLGHKECKYFNKVSSRIIDSCSCLFNTFKFRDLASVLSVTNASISMRTKMEGGIQHNIQITIWRLYNADVNSQCYRIVDVGPPKKPIRRANADGNLSLVQRLLLYDFLEERDGQLVLPLDFVELLDLYSDSDETSDNDENN